MYVYANWFLNIFLYHVSAPENITVIQTRRVGIVFSVSHKLPFMDSEYDSIKLGPRANDSYRKLWQSLEITYLKTTIRFLPTKPFLVC